MCAWEGSMCMCLLVLCCWTHHLLGREETCLSQCWGKREKRTSQPSTASWLCIFHIKLSAFIQLLHSLQVCSSTTNLKTLPAAVSSIRSDTFLPQVKKRLWKASPPSCRRKHSPVLGKELLSPSPPTPSEPGGQRWGFPREPIHGLRWALRGVARSRFWSTATLPSRD